MADGQIVSDSHSYRKNEAASRRIETELQLNTPAPTPEDLKPGGREAIQNAARRAERRGTAAPTVDPAVVRLAVAEARDRYHLAQLLAAEGIEAEFDRRGQALSVYGWRLRRQGADEWLKASTVARDLSWPKIAHRFVDDDPVPVPVEADQATLQAKKQYEATIDDTKTKPEPTITTAQKRDRVPAMVRRMVQQPKTEVDIQASSRAIWDDPNTGPGTKILLQIGLWCFKAAQPLINALMSLLNWLLAKVGLKLGPAAPGSVQSETALPHQPEYLEAETRVVPNRNAQVALNSLMPDLIKVRDALAQDDPSLLPAGPATAELVKAMVEADNSIAVGASNVGSSVEILRDREIKQKIDEPNIGDLLITFKAEVAAHQIAAAALTKAVKPDYASLPFYLSQTDRLREQYEAADRQNTAAELILAEWKSKNKLLSALTVPGAMKKRCAETASILAQIRAELRKSEAQDLAAERRANALPPRLARPEVIASASESSERAKQTWESLKNRFIAQVANAKMLDPSLGQSLNSVATKLDRITPRGMTDKAKSASFFADFEAVMQEFEFAKASSYILNPRVEAEQYESERNHQRQI